VAEPVPASSVHDVAAAEPVIRRVIAARAANPAEIDDLVQDCLERLLTARGRLAPEAVLPYAIVTARNLVSSHARNAARRAAAAPRLVDTREPDRPEDMVLAGESRDAMMTALGRLSDQERSDILAYYNEDFLRGGDALKARGALRVRMARTRAKLRLEYLLAFRGADLPSAVCYRVLLAVSAGDTRRQRALNAGQHLLECEACAALSEPLERRSIGLTAFTIPAGLAAWAVRTARAQPLHAAGAAAGAAAVAVAAVVGPRLVAPDPAPAAHPQPASSAPAPAAVIRGLSVAGQPVPWAAARGSLRSMIGEHAVATGVNAQAAVTHNGFWVGSAAARIWVQLVGPLRPLHIRAGDQLRFAGTVVGNGPSYPAKIGVTSPGDTALLARQGAHLTVSTTSIRVMPAS
jgi:RNA polymerase sigma factor (sigma-70 family)